MNGFLIRRRIHLKGGGGWSGRYTDEEGGTAFALHGNHYRVGLYPGTE